MPAALHPLVRLVELGRFDQLAGKQRRIAALDDLHLTQHRAHDHFDVLVVDVDALRAVDLLHFLNEVVLQRGLALDAQDVVRVERAFVELIARLDALPVLRQHVRTGRDLVLVLFAVGVKHVDEALILLVAEPDRAARLRRLSLDPSVCAPRRSPRRAADR